MTFQNSLGRTRQRKSKGGGAGCGHAEIYADRFVAKQGRVEEAMKVCLSLHCYLKQWPLSVKPFLVNLSGGLYYSNCMHRTLLSKACNIKVSSRAMKPSTWSGILS